MADRTMRFLLTAAAAVLLSGCLGDTDAVERETTGPAVELGTRSVDPVDPLDDRPTGPLPDLPECGERPPPADRAVPDDLVLPQGSIVTEVTEVLPVTTYAGYVPLTPSQFRRTYQRREDIRIITVEDDTFDAELTFSSGDLRIYVQVLAVCDQGSRFAAIASPDTVQPLPD